MLLIKTVELFLEKNFLSVSAQHTNLSAWAQMFMLKYGPKYVCTYHNILYIIADTDTVSQTQWEKYKALAVVDVRNKNWD